MSLGLGNLEIGVMEIGGIVNSRIRPWSGVLLGIGHRGIQAERNSPGMLWTQAAGTLEKFLAPRLRRDPSKMAELRLWDILGKCTTFRLQRLLGDSWIQGGDVLEDVLTLAVRMSGEGYWTQGQQDALGDYIELKLWGLLGGINELSL